MLLLRFLIGALALSITCSSMVSASKENTDYSSDLELCCDAETTEQNCSEPLSEPADSSVTLDEDVISNGIDDQDPPVDEPSISARPISCSKGANAISHPLKNTCGWSLELAVKKAVLLTSRRIVVHCLTATSIDPVELLVHAIAGVFEYTVGVVWDNKSSISDFYLTYGG